MQTITLIETEGAELDIIRSLFREYEEELNEDLCFQSFEAELRDPLKKYVQSGGAIMLAYVDDEPAGCIALLPHSQSDCEMKRLFVRPAYRKSGLGRELVQLLLDLAKEKGFTSMKLDTLNKLQPAIKLYEQFGFTHTNAYYNNPLPGVVYMQKEL